MVLALMLLSRGAIAQEPFENWNLEPGVAQAHLVMVARVASIGQLTVVEGAKTDVTLREYRFQPIRKLKGIFQRDELSMTAADLGCPAEDASRAPLLKEGEFRLLILAQQRGNVAGCVSAAPGAITFEERVPLLSGPDDPLVAAVETLIQVVDSRSRRERATLVIDRLVDADGLSAVPLLTSLLARTDWAAADSRSLPALARLTHSPLAAVRGAALGTLRDLLASQISPEDPRQLDIVAEALRERLESDEPITRLRLAALEALGHLLALKSDFDWPRDLLIKQLASASTRAEQAAATTALSRIAHPDAIAAVLNALSGLPLDETAPNETIYAQAAIQLDAAAATRILLARLERSLAARQSLKAEVESLGTMRIAESLPLLLSAAGQSNLAPIDKQRIAWTLGRLGDDQAVPILIDWMRNNDYQLRELALGALEQLDSPTAAREARPLLKSEPHLPYKFRLARLLARHKLADGYPLAIEHLADSEHTAEATMVLVALDDPRTSPDLSAILDAQPDSAWRAAALTGLAAIGDAAVQKKLLKILGDDRNGFVAAAAQAAGLTTDTALLLPLSAMAKSRNTKIAMASLLGLRRFFSGVRTSPQGLWALEQTNVNDLQPVAVAVAPETTAAIAETVAALVSDPYVDANLRREAWAVAKLLRGDLYDELLTKLADQSELENTPLLADVQSELRRERERAKSP
jgi:HEAT repeat protein